MAIESFSEKANLAKIRSQFKGTTEFKNINTPQPMRFYPGRDPKLTQLQTQGMGLAAKK